MKFYTDPLILKFHISPTTSDCSPHKIIDIENLNLVEEFGLPSIDVLASYASKPILLEITGGSKFGYAAT